MKETNFVEVVKVKDGVFIDPQPHIERILRTTLHFFSKPLTLQLTDDLVPVDLRKGIVKCRIVYNKEIISIDFEPYKIRNIQHLAIVEDDTIEYRYKYLNRNAINDLLKYRKDCDDILIVKNSLVTDTSYTNVVFKDPHGKLYTPTSTLLAGTKRQRLLGADIIHEREILVSDISSYVGVYLINAMIDIEDNLFIDIHSIH